jgi:hypothetical protein
MLISCGSDPKVSSGKKEHFSGDSGEDLTQQGAKDPSNHSSVQILIPKVGTLNSQSVQTSLTQIQMNRMGEDASWALSHCNCASHFKGQVLQRWVQLPGVVPHPLVPDLREGVIADPQVQLILGLPGALSDSLGDLFLDDAQLEAQLIEGVKSNLLNSSPGIGDFSNWPGFRFELFPHTGSATEGGSLSIPEQVSRWNLIWSLDSMWFGAEPLTLGSHLAQLHQVLLSVSEWKYLFGIDESSITKKSYGGMALRKSSGLNGPMQPFDPRQDPDGHGFFSGTYQIEFDPTVSKMDLAIRGTETWTNSTESIGLRNQARQWNAAAIAFERLKPSGRGAVPQLFASGGGIMPEDAHQLPLAFLPGLAALLDGPFIREETREVFSATKLSDEPGTLATLKDLSSLVTTLGRWLDSLEDVTNEGLAPEVVEQLGGGRAQIKQALQLATQSMLLMDFASSPVGDQVEALAVLSSVANRSFSSPFLDSQIIRLTNQFFTENLALIWEGAVLLDSSHYIWLSTLFESLQRFAPTLLETPEFIQLASQLREEIEFWSDSY